MFYIHATSCISSQRTFRDVDISIYQKPDGNKISVFEPSYNEIPEKILRRMGKAVRLGVGAAMPLIDEENNPDGIIIGTANGGMEDCIKFLNQIIEYKEGMLTPTNFVQSTANAVAGQVGMLSRNNGYNITHVHRGHSFENAILDAAMHLRDNPDSKLLIGAVDEISAYNYNIDLLAGWFKTTAHAGLDMYDINSAGSFPGEGAAMFQVSSRKTSDSIKLEAITTITTTDEAKLREIGLEFISKHRLDQNNDVLYLSGENGDKRLDVYYSLIESLLSPVTRIARFKHISGEFATATAIGLWLSGHILRTQNVPDHMWKNALSPHQKADRQAFNKILIYNNHKGIQHSLLLCSIS
jgi:hypothetical protein